MPRRLHVHSGCNDTTVTHLKNQVMSLLYGFIHLICGVIYNPDHKKFSLFMFLKISNLWFPVPGC